MLTETDGPFTEGRVGRARPEDALSCVEGLADIFGIPVADMQSRIVGNLLAMLKKAAY